MRAVVQRVRWARVEVDGAVIGNIDHGLLIYLGAGKGDDDSSRAYVLSKILGLRIFENAEGKMDKSVVDVGGALLVVSQFTLYGDVRRGRRPDFTAAASPDVGRRLYDGFCGVLRTNGLTVATGVFGAAMRVQIDADGPVTIIVSTDRWSEGEL